MEVRVIVPINTLSGLHKVVYIGCLCNNSVQCKLSDSLRRVAENPESERYDW